MVDHRLCETAVADVVNQNNCVTISYIGWYRSGSSGIRDSGGGPSTHSALGTPTTLLLLKLIILLLHILILLILLQY